MNPVRITYNRGRIKIGSHIRQNESGSLLLTSKNVLYGIIYFGSGCFFWCPHSEPDPLKLISGDRKIGRVLTGLKHDFFIELLGIIKEIGLFGRIYIIFQRKKIKKKSKNSRNQGFSYYFCLMIEGSGSGD